MARTVNISPKNRVFWVICEPDENGGYVPIWVATGYTRYHAWESYAKAEEGIDGKPAGWDTFLEFKRACQKCGYVAVKMKGVLSK